jgi:tellurite resistance protein
MKSDGNLTGQERQKLNNMQDRSSRNIYNQKHDAQAANVGAGAPGNANDPRVQKRLQNQDQRIDQGVKSGTLTPKEAGRLEADQARVQQTEERMKSDGNLTGQERQKLNNMQDRSSRNIYNQKHDAQTANVGAGAPSGKGNDPRVQKRMQNQDRRIDQGVKSGELTPKEAGRLETDQARIQQTEERMKSDGNLTGQERQKLNTMQDRASDRIDQQKHDRQRAPVKQGPKN